MIIEIYFVDKFMYYQIDFIPKKEIFMPFVDLKDLKKRREIIAGAKARIIHMDGMTLSYWNFAEGTKLPEHSHPHEQMTKLIKGRFEMTVDGETKILEDSDIAVIPSNALHSGRAITDCELLDVFSPVREDYK